ncbi:lantibiotic dehydratase [Algoriphagus terrigena]|uniref:lantibiotic dehydratase n=1 Tax=Algoriphagus terrigena TaxID=344884 RepID=UPI0012F8F2F6|nr:lantibiotic dehydratase [Algoriphagus terrigena]
MHLLFRLPLFHFDIENPETLEKHRETILEAIKLSSTVFYKELEEKPFAELDEKQRIKLRKYLLRGRYRPTPFGKFAGVGIANWGKYLKPDFLIQSSELNPAPPSHSNTTSEYLPNPLESDYILVSGIHQKNGYYEAMILDSKAQRWTACKFPQNMLFDVLIKQASEKTINFREFHQLLNPKESAITREQANQIWNQIIDSGFLIPQSIPNPPKKGIDIILKNQPEIPETVKTQLDRFVNSAGSLFSKEESTYLQDFKKWFTIQFDDRYVSLNDLLTHGEFFSGSFHNPDQNPEQAETDIAAILLGSNGKKTVDLGQQFSKSELPQEIFDLQILYRLDANLNPVIENIVCNRPFVYTGRFNRDPEIETYSKTIRGVIYTNQEIIYANLSIRETEAINHICDVSTILEYEITPFPTTSSRQLDFRDLYLGIHQSRIGLIHKPTGKQVIPVVLHPLNGNQITHPILRLLWEIAHQDRFRFLPYQSPILSQAPSCPQLNWDNLCLQSRRWNQNSKIATDTKSLSKKLDELAVPQYILAGNMDRELLLNRHCSDDLKILNQELQRNKNLTLSEPLWYPSNQFQSEEGIEAYPQFVYQFSRYQSSPKLTGYFNPITKTQSNCLCIVLTCCGSEVTEVLERLFLRMEEEKILSEAPLWFFLIYGKNGSTEIRLRLLEISEDHQQALLLKLSLIFKKENWNWKTAPYYPETYKYGSKSLEISHRLFHLESKFLFEKTTSEPPLCHHPDWKENTLIHLWCSIILHCPNQLGFFSSLKEHVKQMPAELLIRLKSEFNYLQTDEQYPFPERHYLNLLRSHRLFYCVGEQVTYFFHNHLHMMVNRFFHVGAADHELRIRYKLYRELGKHLYAGPIPLIDSFPKPEFIADSFDWIEPVT